MAAAGHGATANGQAPPCEHIDRVHRVEPRTAGCEQCLDLGQSWVGLRLCLSCGWVACSDDSPNRHAEAHYRETDHPVVADCAPGSTWRWCYAHRRAL
jgi:uncharacterized UBP type Zn finger protein